MLGAGRFVLAGLGVALAACQERPSEAQLAAWRGEAQAANAAALAALADKVPDGEAEARAWTLTISGQTRRDAPEVLDMATLEALSTTHVKTWSPQSPAARAAPLDFRGVSVAALLERVGVADGVTHVTFVSTDAFRTTVPVEDLRRYPITLALYEGDARIPRSSGGPLFLVFPYSDAPEIVERYNDRFWSFYVTHVVVGTEPIAVRLGERVYDAAALAALPQTTATWPVGFRGHWPTTPVALHGVKVADLLTAAGVQGGQALVVRGKGAMHVDPKAPIRFAWADVAGCELMLVTAHGRERAPVPAQLGGPVGLAMSPTCGDRYPDKTWVTFVSALVVE